MNLISLVCVPLSIVLLAANQQPAELQQLRTSYDGAVQRAVRPISEAYLKELKRLRDSYVRSARQADVAQVDEEIRLITEKLAVLEGAVPSTVGSRTVILDSRVTIPANSPAGFSLGAVRQGDVITLQYVEGLWKAYGTIATANPDEFNEKDDESRLAIARGPVKEKPGEVIVVVPPRTSAKPFSFTFPTTRDDVVLRIHKNSDNKKNPGSVIYQVKIMR